MVSCGSNRGKMQKQESIALHGPYSKGSEKTNNISGKCSQVFLKSWGAKWVLLSKQFRDLQLSCLFLNQILQTIRSSEDDVPTYPR